MINFYRDAAAASLILLVVTGLIIFWAVMQSRLYASLYPSLNTDFFIAAATEPKTPKGDTRLTLKNEVGTIDYEFFLSSSDKHPYSHYSLYFADSSFLQTDLTRYSSIVFKIQCDPQNILLFTLFSFDDRITDMNYLPSRRVSSQAFACNKNWAEVRIRFEDLNTPQWWLDRYDRGSFDTSYRLDKTLGFAWVNSIHSPVDTLSHVRLTDIGLQGTDLRYIYGAITFSVLAWILFAIWQFRRYLGLLKVNLKEKIREDQSVIAYKKLSIEPQKDKEKSSLLRYMATEYSKPDLSLEIAAASLGINRTKINDMLKEELGLTFGAYVNKLRLTEAARLLAENQDANISEIAYSVGYNNLSYFSKLFKQEYGCVPKTFKSLHMDKDDTADFE